MSDEETIEGTIPVAEMFYSIQGEGPTAGTPAVFLRLGGCNLLCGDPDDPDAPQEELTPDGEGATWVCDTIEEWRNASGESIEALLDEFDARGWTEVLANDDANLILTGGEPMLQQDALAEFLRALGPETVEVETNGTIVPTDPFDELVDHYNVSLKLPNSGMDESRRVNEEAIEVFANDDRAVFKFVVSHPHDLGAIRAMFNDHDLPHGRTMLMPAGASREELRETYPRVAELAKRYGVEFSPRLQIMTWDEATGV